MKQSTASREHLIEAARALFAQQGYDGASVRDITRRAKVNLGAITYHFGSKEGLYHAVIEGFAVPLADRLAAIASEPGPPVQRIADVLRAFFDHIGEHPEMPSMIVRELASGRPLAAPVAQVIERNVQSVSRIIVQGQADGSIRPGEPALIAMTIAAHPLFFAVARAPLQHALGTDPREPAVRTRIVEHVIATLEGGLANPVRTATPQDGAQ